MRRPKAQHSPKGLPPEGPAAGGSASAAKGSASSTT